MQIKALFLSATASPVRGRVYSSTVPGKQHCCEAALSPRWRLQFPWEEWGIPGELEGVAEGQADSGNLCPEQERRGKQWRSWQSWRVTLCSALRTLMDYPVYSSLVLQRLGRKVWAERCTICKNTPFFHFLLPEHNSSLSVAGKVAKIQLSQDSWLLPARCGCWLELCPAHNCRQCTLRKGNAVAAESTGFGRGLATYRVSGNSKLLCFHSLSDEVLGQVVCKHYSLFHSWFKTWDSYSFSLRISQNK